MACFLPYSPKTRLSRLRLHGGPHPRGSRLSRLPLLCQALPRRFFRNNETAWFFEVGLWRPQAPWGPGLGATGLVQAGLPGFDSFAVLSCCVGNQSAQQARLPGTCQDQYCIPFVQAFMSLACQQLKTLKVCCKVEGL